MTPLLIPLTPIRDYLSSRSLRQNEDVMVGQRSPAYVDEELFFESISNVFIPDGEGVRSHPGLETETAMLEMDSALSHTSARILEKLGEKNIIVITFLTHTTNLSQTLDLMFFGLLQKFKATAIGKFDDDSVDAQIRKLVQASEQRAASSTIKESFRKAGMDLGVTIQPFRIQIVEQILTENPGFKEVCNRNVSLEDLSRRQQLRRFGIAHYEFLRVYSISWNPLISLSCYVLSAGKPSLFEGKEKCKPGFTV
jgi:hypothetical protein